MIAATLLALIGVASALAYLRARQGLNAALVLLAAAGLAVLLSGWVRPGERDPTVPTVANAEDAISLDFPRQLALGRSFALSLRRSEPLAHWRLQLLDENGGLLAQTSAEGREATVRWLPPVAEALVLQARMLDAAGKVLAQGPVPVEVLASRPLQVQGRFAAPSFDTQALNSLLGASQANLDWQLALGRAITRAETPRAVMAAPELIVVDAAYVEGLSVSARAALLAQVGRGAPLIVLAANAREPALWSRELQLPLSAVEPVAMQAEPGLELLSAPLQPRPAARSPWSAGTAGLWLRPWQQGRIVWLGVMDWHRHAIAAPQRLGSWWQTVLDQAQLQQQRDLQWQFPDVMPMVDRRSVVCVRGVMTDLAVTAEQPAMQLLLQRRSDRADDACAALWPQQSGWLKLSAADAQLVAGRLYVYARDDWPQWQRAIRRDAEATLAARAPLAAASSAAAARAPVPAWAWGLLFVFAGLALWWRERRLS